MLKTFYGNLCLFQPIHQILRFSSEFKSTFTALKKLQIPIGLFSPTKYHITLKTKILNYHEKNPSIISCCHLGNFMRI